LNGSAQSILGQRVPSSFRAVSSLRRPYRCNLNSFIARLLYTAADRDLAVISLSVVRVLCDKTKAASDLSANASDRITNKISGDIPLNRKSCHQEPFSAQNAAKYHSETHWGAAPQTP